MRRGLVVVVVASVSWAAWLACSSYGSASSSGGVPEGGDDASTPPDSPTAPPPAADAAVDGTVFFDDFEDGDCARYEAFLATVAPTDVAHTGTRGCALCRAGDGGRPQASRQFVPPPEGGTYTLQYFARTLDGGAPRTAFASMLLAYPDGSATYDGAIVALSTTWTAVAKGGVRADAGATDGRVIVLGDPATTQGECFVFDDVRLVLTPE